MRAGRRRRGRAAAGQRDRADGLAALQARRGERAGSEREDRTIGLVTGVRRDGQIRARDRLAQTGRTAARTVRVAGEARADGVSRVGIGEANREVSPAACCGGRPEAGAGAGVERNRRTVAGVRRYPGGVGQRRAVGLGGGAGVAGEDGGCGREGERQGGARAAGAGWAGEHGRVGTRMGRQAVGHGVTCAGGAGDVRAVELPLAGEKVAAGDDEGEGERLARQDGLVGQAGELQSQAGHGEGVFATTVRRQGGDAQARHIQGGGMGEVILGAHSQGPVGVDAHGPQRAVGFCEQRVAVTRRHGHDIAACAHGGVLLADVAVTQLAIGVVAHGPQHAV